MPGDVHRKCPHHMTNSKQEVNAQILSKNNQTFQQQQLNGNLHQYFDCCAAASLQQSVPKISSLKAVIKTEMSPFIYTAVFILKHFINYLSKDHCNTDFAVFLLCLPNHKKEADCTLFRIHQIKP